MSKIQLYIAVTLDGYIARSDGSLDYLHALPNPDQTDHGYRAFFQDVGTVVMGRKTYEEILGFGVAWPYANCQTYVITSNHNYEPSTEATALLVEPLLAALNKLKSESEKHVWIVGGGQVITTLLNKSLIDEMILSIIPIILGEGISLFPGNPRETSFNLIKAEPFATGVVNLTYRRA
ncbi:MAG: dihydrofolate reductase family protein [Tunicatimonas sp.]